jgi:hypothetical protein
VPEMTSYSDAYRTLPGSGRRMPVLLPDAQVRLYRLGRAAALLVGIAIVATYLLERSVAQQTWLDPALPIRASLDRLGISVAAYSTLVASLELAFMALCAGLGLVIFLGKASGWYGTFVAVTLVSIGAAVPQSAFHLLEIEPSWDSVSWVVTVFSWTLFGLFMYLFPDGRFTPRWTLYLAATWVAVQFLAMALPGTLADPTSWAPGPRTVYFFSWLLTGVAAQGYHYLRIASREQRQQTKWVLVGLAVAYLVPFAIALPPALFPTAEMSLLRLAVTPVMLLAAMLVPVTIAVSVRRYHLWDIDIFVNRAVVYGTLTAVLGGLFAALIGLTQRVFIALTGDRSDAAVVLTTLVLVSVSHPLKTSVQGLVDRWLGDGRDGRRRLAKLGSDIEHVLDVLHPERVARRAFEDAVLAFHTDAGALHIVRGGVPTLDRSLGEWERDHVLTLPVWAHGQEVATIRLGARGDGMSYTIADIARLERTLTSVGNAFELRDALD